MFNFENIYDDIDIVLFNVENRMPCFRHFFISFGLVAKHERFYLKNNKNNTYMDRSFL